MAQSVEYPDLQRVEPRWYTRGRSRAGQPTIVVVHHTAGSEGPTSAEAGAAYDARRESRVSCHYFHDSNSTVQCVYTWDTSWTAHTEGNARGIHHELCGTLQTREQWLDPASDGTLWQAARQIARDCRKYGIPVRRLTIAQMRAGEKGICGHGDVTVAWGQGDHTDPGPGFPWDVLLQRALDFFNGSSEDTMATIPQADWDNLDWSIGRALRDGSSPIPGGPVAGGRMWLVDRVRDLVTGQALSAQREQAMLTAIQTLADAIAAGGGNVDVAAIIAAVEEQSEITRALIESKDAEIDALNVRLAEAYAGGDTPED